MLAMTGDSTLLDNHNTYIILYVCYNGSYDLRLSCPSAVFFSCIQVIGLYLYDAGALDTREFDFLTCFIHGWVMLPMTRDDEPLAIIEYD